VHCALGINDAVAGDEVSTTIAAITTIRQACSASDFFLYLEPQPAAVDAAVWSTFGDALYQLADTLDVPLFDLQDRLGGYAVEAANGLTGDAVAHLNRAGYAEWGRAVGLAASR
jgi:lysophospholipase L1-like esterase